MASQGPGRKRTPNRNGVTPEEDALNVIAREAEARLTAKRAARAEAREIRMKELERQQKEIYQVQKKYYGLENLDNKWGDIEQWMEDSEQYTHHSQRRASLSEYSSLLGSSSRTSSRASSRCTSPVENTNSSVASFLQKAASSSGVRDLYHVTIPELPDLDDGLERDFFNKGSSRVSTISTSTLTSLGGASSSKESGDSSVTADTETSLQDIKEIHELKDQIHDVETKYTQNLKEIKDSLSEMEIKYRNTMVSNAQLDNEKSNLVYEVDTLKDSLMELEEVLSETRRECEEKSKDLEREKHAHSILQFQFSEQKETLKQSEGLLTEIRQLHVKKDEFIREISDLQETVKWKDKKIKALEKQKEFSDAIRNERDELRDEVVQLKDILKKHGIALGSDLCTNGEVGVNVSGGAACTELERGSSVLGTQKLQLFRDENVGGSRRGQLQHPQEFGHGIEENHLPSSGPGSSFKSHMRAQYEGVGLGIYLTNAIEKIQNNVEKTQAVSEANAEKKVVLENVKEPTEPNANIIEGIRTDQQESPLYVKRSETIKERSHDFANKLTCEMKKDIDQNLDETVVGDSQMVTDNSPLAKIDTVNSQCASISVKKKKKKKKQKQKHNCDEKDVRLKIGENKNQRGSVQTVVSECKSVHLEEATVNEKVTDNVNMNKTVDRADIAIGNPPHDHLLKSITGDLTASLLTNSKDARLKDIVAFCAEISTGTQLGDTVDTAEVFQEKQETFTDTKLGDSVDTAEFCEEKKETFTDIQLGDTVDTAKVLEEKQKTFTDAHLGDTLDTVELHQEKQETFTGTLPGDNVDTAEVFQEKQETSTGMPLGSTVDTAEVYQKKQKTFTGTQLYDTVDTAEVLEETQKTFTDTYLGDTVDRVEVYQKKQETFTGMQPDDTVDTAEVLEEKQEIFTDMHLSDTVDTAEVYQEKQETFTGMQLDDTVATAKFLEEKKESQQPLHIDQKFNLERDECEMEIEESFDFNMKVIKLEEHLLGDNDCQKEHIIPWCEKQTCTTSERPELADTKNEDQKLQIDEQNFLMEKDKGASVAQIPTPGGNCETYGQEFLPGYEEQGSKTHKEMIHFEHNGKQGTSPAKDVKVLDALLP